MNTIAIVAALLFGATPPGSLITVQASCSGNIGGTVIASPVGSGCLGVISPVFDAHKAPVFLGRYFTKFKNADGSTAVRQESLADGMLVRFLKKSAEGNYILLEGIQLNDGRVLVDENPVQRDE